MFYCSRTTEISRSALPPYRAQSSGRDRAVKQVAAVSNGDL